MGYDGDIKRFEDQAAREMPWLSLPAIPQLGIDRIAQGVAEQAGAEHGEDDPRPGKIAIQGAVVA